MLFTAYPGMSSTCLWHTPYQNAQRTFINMAPQCVNTHTTHTHANTGNRYMGKYILFICCVLCARKCMIHPCKNISWQGLARCRHIYTFCNQGNDLMHCPFHMPLRLERYAFLFQHDWMFQQPSIVPTLCTSIETQQVPVLLTLHLCLKNVVDQNLLKALLLQLMRKYS